MTRNGLRAVVLAAAVSVAGCESSVNFADWAAGFDKAIAEAHNENMLINMVRAAYNDPMHFTTIAVARGSGTASGGLTLTSPFSRGPDGSRPFPSAAVNLTVTGQYNFDMASLDNSEFMAGLLTPIAPATVHFYVNQGIPRELLFNLLIDRITITQGGKINNYENDPNLPGYKNFLSTLSNLLALGLTTESIPSFLPFGPPLTANEAKDPRVLAAAAAAGVMLEPAGNGMYQIVKPINVARFCFTGQRPDLAKLPPSALCGAAEPTASPSASGAPNASEQKIASGANIPGFDDASLSVTIRSTRAVFNYLGNAIYQQVERPDPQRLEMQTTEAKEYNYLKRGDALLVVLKNQSHTDDLVHIDYRGDIYSIPYDQQGNSNLVFTVVSQILNLSKSINLIPATSAVVVR